MADLPEQTELFGGWTLRASRPLADLGQWKLRIEGSAGSDGLVALTSGTPFALHVTGDPFTVTVLTRFPSPPPGGWYPRPPVRVVRRAGALGVLEVVIEGQSGSDVYPSRPLVLVCEQDPDPDLPEPGPPWDFGLPGAGGGAVESG